MSENIPDFLGGFLCVWPSVLEAVKWQRDATACLAKKKKKCNKLLIIGLVIGFCFCSSSHGMIIYKGVENNGGGRGEGGWGGGKKKQ